MLASRQFVSPRSIRRTKSERRKYHQFPKSEEDWRHIAKDFEEKWNFPHALGAVDGKHVRIIPPANSGSFYFNYKGYHSLVLLGIVNANCEFTLVDFGVNGRISDGGVLEYTEFYRRLISNKLNVPKPATCEDLPFVFIGDEAFSLRENFMKPFSQKNLTEDRRVYNYFLSRTRRVVENAFGILSARFRIFHTAISLKPDNIDAVVMACCVLHNFLRRKCASSYITAADLEGSTTEDNPLVGLRIGHNRNCSLDPKSVREIKFTGVRSEDRVQAGCVYVGRVQAVRLYKENPVSL
ncbi:putative nuclease HARBI1 [Anabrus simplex]|uniref:putative nuclease HARBI1 n=1 Tax=Anabrus simplex TaxID=316456 RepID=UPI0035A2816A